MIVRTYSAELSGPALESSGVVAVPLRRLRAWTATFGRSSTSFTLRRASAVPAAVDVRRGNAAAERLAVRNPEAPILAMVEFASTLGSLAAGRKRR